MVRLTLKRHLRDDSCCKVEVMKGATALRFFSLVATDLIHFLPVAFAQTQNWKSEEIRLHG